MSVQGSKQWPSQIDYSALYEMAASHLYASQGKVHGINDLLSRVSVMVDKMLYDQWQAAQQSILTKLREPETVLKLAREFINSDPYERYPSVREGMEAAINAIETIIKGEL